MRKYQRYYKPLASTVMINPYEEPETKTKAGIILLGTQAKDSLVKGVVVSTGPGRPDVPMEVKQRDIVYYARGDARNIDFEGKTFVIINMDKILAKV